MKNWWKIDFSIRSMIDFVIVYNMLKVIELFIRDNHWTEAFWWWRIFMEKTHLSIAVKSNEVLENQVHLFKLRFSYFDLYCLLFFISNSNLDLFIRLDLCACNFLFFGTRRILHMSLKMRICNLRNFWWLSWWFDFIYF